MQKDRLNQICKSFCTAFPNIEFALLDPGGRPAQVHSPRGLLAQMEAGPLFAGHTAVLEGVPYRVLRHALPQGLSLIHIWHKRVQAQAAGQIAHRRAPFGCDLLHQQLIGLVAAHARLFGIQHRAAEPGVPVSYTHLWPEPKGFT